MRYTVSFWFIVRGCFVIMPAFCPITCAHSPSSTAPKQVMVNVFVHGIVGITPHLTIPNIIRLMRDDIDQTHYQRSVQYLRKDDFFCTAQAMGAEGLHPVNMKLASAGYGPGALSNAIEHINTYFNIERTLEHRYYTFGWSGLATTSARAKAGQRLYDELENVTQQLTDKEISYTLRIYGYSHGGNVVLAAAHNAPKQPSFYIDQAILLGMPVQCETDYLVTHPLFRSIYHLYSRTDFVPAMDCFSLKRFFSGKTFQSRKGFTLPDKLTQIQIRITDTIRSSRSYRHINTRLTSFITGNTWFLRDRSPNHSEWWFFEWTAYGYRDRFPLRPLCIAAFAPYILRAVQMSTVSVMPNTPLVVDLRPYYEQTIIRPLYHIEPVVKIAFCSIDTLAQWKTSLKPFETAEMTAERYNQHVSHAMACAQEQLERERKKHDPQGQSWSLLFWN